MHVRFLIQVGLIFSAVTFVSSPCYAPNPLGDEEAKEVHRYLSSKWKPVEDYEKPVGFGTIFNFLNPELWPALPESYEWRINGENVELYKHKSASPHEFDFVTYRTDCDDKVDFLSRWDQVTHHAYAYTRQDSPIHPKHPARTVYPITQFEFGTETYMRGHCIDCIDTFGLTDKSRVKGMTIIESISTFDPRNYIPELMVPTNNWGKEVRCNLVMDIRKTGGCYAQYMYYGHTYTRTTDSSATAIPLGVYFVEMDKENTVNRCFHVPWDPTHPVHSAEGKLENVLLPNRFFLSPYVHNIQIESQGKWVPELQLDYQLPDRPLTPEEYHNLVKIADHEIKTISGKACLIAYNIRQGRERIDILLWLKRLIKHAMKIHEMGGYGFLHSRAMEQLAQALSTFPADNTIELLESYLLKLYENDEDKAIKRDKTTFEGLSSLKNIRRQLPQAFHHLNLSGETGKDASTRVHQHLIHQRRLHLTGVTTAHAKVIVKNFSQTFTPEQQQYFEFDITPDPDHQKSSSVNKHFSTIGAKTRLISSSSSSLSNSGSDTLLTKSTSISLTPLLKSRSIASVDSSFLGNDEDPVERYVMEISKLSQEMRAALIARLLEAEQPDLNISNIPQTNDLALDDDTSHDEEENNETQNE